jgi:hypothetical protein
MQENFVISAPTFFYYKNFKSFFVSIIISLIIIYPIFRKNFLSINSIISFVVLTFIIFFIISSITNENLSNEMPSYLYPNLPHTGLDGISLNNYVAGLDVKSNM